MCCEDSGGSSSAPAPVETEFSKTLAQIMKERQESSKKYDPLENQLIDSVQQFQSPDFLGEQVGKSVATADQSADMAAAAQEKQLASMGVDPTSGAYAGNSAKLAMGRSLSRTAAVGQTTDNVRRLAYDTVAGTAGKGDAKVGQAIGAASAGGNQAMQSQQNQMSWQNSQNSANDSAMGGIGQLVGVGLSMFSSRKLKEGLENGDDDAMAEVRKMPVKNWKYRQLTVADDGGVPHTGPMAEDYAAATGEGDGTTINVGHMAGKTMGAVQNIDKRLRKLEKRA